MCIEAITVFVGLITFKPLYEHHSELMVIIHSNLINYKAYRSF